MSDQTTTSTTPADDLSTRNADAAVVASAVPVAALDEMTKEKRLRVAGWTAAGWLILILGSALFADFLPRSAPAAEVADKRFAPLQSCGPILGADANGRD